LSISSFVILLLRQEAGTALQLDHLVRSESTMPTVNQLAFKDEICTSQSLGRVSTTS